jgi:23S rRNA (uracil1939-C5)-methyltransferase
MRDRYDIVVLDPPRQGCAPSVLQRIFGHIKPRRVIYVSCNPEALAEELPSISSSGYIVDRVQPVDMFPHTTHIETVATFSRPSVRGNRGSAAAPPDSPRPRRRRR